MPNWMTADNVWAVVNPTIDWKLARRLAKLSLALALAYGCYCV